MNNNFNMNNNSYYGAPDNNNLFMQMQPKSNAFSIVSLILGIVSITFSCINYLPLVLSVLAITFAVVHRVYTGRFNGMAIAGMTCGIIGLAISATLLIVSIVYIDKIEELLKQYYGEIMSASGSV
ncbi:MAG: hypothetical protein SOZ62_05590 [Eubacteriales bacterium]|nr:hypothetical protein [Eubacteriales bacterium]